MPSIRAAERAGIRWRHVAQEPASPPHRTAAFPPDALIDAAQLGMCDVPISVNAIIARLRLLAEETVRAGHAGLLLLIDMTWLLNTPSGIAHHGEFEAALHELTETSHLHALCLYHLPIFPAALMLDAMRTHPYVQSAEGPRRNPHFLPPAAFLSSDPTDKLRCWLTSLGPGAEYFIEALASQEGARRPTELEGSAAGTLFSLLPEGRASRRGAGFDPLASLSEAPASRRRWKIRCLGNLRIYREDGTPVRWNVVNGATIKTKTLFAYLLHCGSKGASAEEIADLLWPDAESTAQSLNRLYHTIHCLRMALSPDLSSSRDSPFVISNDHRYYLALPEGTWVDIPIFEQFSRRGEKLLRENRLEESLTCHLAAEKLYTGPLFADIPVEYAENMERDWCWSRRYWLEEIYVKMLSTMATIFRQQGNIERALSYAERVLVIDPCFELAHQELMRAFHAIGRRDALERQYKLCCGALKRYEERAPSANTRVLFQRLVS